MDDAARYHRQEVRPSEEEVRRVEEERIQVLNNIEEVEQKIKELDNQIEESAREVKERKEGLAIWSDMTHFSCIIFQRKKIKPGNIIQGFTSTDIYVI